jgi:hypothetical protein
MAPSPAGNGIAEETNGRRRFREDPWPKIVDQEEKPPWQSLRLLWTDSSVNQGRLKIV